MSRTSPLWAGLALALLAPTASRAQDPVPTEPPEAPASPSVDDDEDAPETIPEVPAPSAAPEPTPTDPPADGPTSDGVLGLLGTDIEDRTSQLEEQDRKLETRVFFETEWHEFDNLDFRALDESSDQAILDSDDRNGFAFTGISLELGYQTSREVRLVVGTSYRGLWGNDQIGNINRFGGFLYFTSLYAEWAPRIGAGEYTPVIRVGRQRFDLGGMGGAREFIFGDIVDQLRVDLPLPKIGTLTVIPVNVVGLSADNDDVNFVGFVGQANSQIFGFRGDRMTRRHGAVLTIKPDAVPGLDIRTYGFYSDIGAFGSGADITYNGRLGNFSDNDWVGNAGLRASYTILDWITPFASFDASFGIDRKELVVDDVDATGFAWSAGLVLDKDKDHKRDLGVHAEVRYFEAQGPTYKDDGTMFSHGYVGMKARQVGGLAANRFLGWHPTAYLGAFGLENTPHDIDRKSGMRVISVEGDVELPGIVTIGAGYWYLADTGLTALDIDRVDDIVPPFGYSREEFRAQERLGRLLGHEVDLRVGVEATKELTFYAQGAVLLPGAFYGIEVGRAAGTQLGSANPQLFWDASAGARLEF